MVMVSYGKMFIVKIKSFLTFIILTDNCSGVAPDQFLNFVCVTIFCSFSFFIAFKFLGISFLNISFIGKLYSAPKCVQEECCSYDINFLLRRSPYDTYMSKLYFYRDADSCFTYQFSCQRENLSFAFQPLMAFAFLLDYIYML